MNSYATYGFLWLCPKVSYEEHNQHAKSMVADYDTLPPSRCC